MPKAFGASLFDRDSCPHGGHGTNHYPVRCSNESPKEILRNVDLNFHGAYSNPAFANKPNAIRVQSLQAYRQLLEQLQNQGWSFRTARDLAGATPTGPTVHLRHDVDGDLRAAGAMSEIESHLGISSTYYILHTAPYYGQVRADGQSFLRHRSMARIYRRLQDNGHEVGLHNDALHVTQAWGFDGIRAVSEEIEWLRSVGLSVSGTVAHNSVGTYGAANFAIFSGRPTSFSNTTSYWCIEKADKVTRLGSLSESALSLAYEGNDLLWGPESGVTSFALLRGDVWYGQLAKKHTLTALKSGNNDGPWFTTQSMLRALQSDAHSAGLVVLHIHPMYFGFRRSSRDDLSTSLRLAIENAGPRTVEPYNPYLGRPVPDLKETPKTIALPSCECRDWPVLAKKFSAALDDFEGVGALHTSSTTDLDRADAESSPGADPTGLICSECGRASSPPSQTNSTSRRLLGSLLLPWRLLD